MGGGEWLEWGLISSRINVIAQIANATVTTRMLYAEVHPKLSLIDGRYPRDFDVPRRVEELLNMDSML
jgi:hypothetical protein